LRSIGKFFLIMAAAAAAAVAGLVLTAAGLGFFFSAPRWRGPKSDHFDGRRFFLPRASTRAGGFGSFLRFLRTRRPSPWPTYRGEPAGPPPPRDAAEGALRATFINHATVLLQLDGVNVLTDPIWSERASPFSFLGPRRARPAGIRFDDLPRIDAVLLSHNHYDHLDLPTLRRIRAKFPAARICAGLGVRAFLESHGLGGSEELDWWRTRQIAGVRLTCVPAQHFSSRGAFDRDATLWCAWVLEGKGGRVYFAGDTGYGPHFCETGERLGPFRLALLPIGAYEPLWFMGPVHQNPAEAVRAMKDLRAAEAIGIHYGTFRLTDEGIDRPVADLETALSEEHPRPRFFVLGFGEGRDIPPLP
jgi:L-ascorbate metabolism protein UlaG (beta-lactamase superfamily)